MSYFKKKIFYHNLELDFHFSEIQRLHSSHFHITVKEEDIPKASFDMKKNHEGNWMIIPPVPYWLLNAETLLSRCIQEYKK